MDDLEPDDGTLLDTGALRRRVLLTGVVCMALYLALAYTVSALDVSSAWLLPGLVLVYVLVARPMLRPAREAIALRRRLAYAAYLEGREHEDPQRG